VISRLAVGLVLFPVFALAEGCSNTSDPRVLEAAESLVPSGSAVTEITENTVGLSIETGPYFATYGITDGGLGLGLVDAIDEQAEETGWHRTVRVEGLGGIELRYERDDLRALVYVWTGREPVTASITVRIADRRDVPSQASESVSRHPAVLASALLIDRKWAGPRRTGRRVVANAVILVTAFILSDALRRWMPMDYPVAVAGLVLPAFLAAEVAVDWRNLGEPNPA
jgi:hypothetical protein